MRTTFQDELNMLESTLHEEGELVLRALRGALNALEQRDHELADEVIQFDDDVDQRYISIEEGIQTLLAQIVGTPKLPATLMPPLPVSRPKLLSTPMTQPPMISGKS